jgi:hypothetical protein
MTLSPPTALRYPLHCSFLQGGVTICLTDILRFRELKDSNPPLVEVFCKPGTATNVDGYSRVRPPVLFAEYPGLYSYWAMMSASSTDEEEATLEAIRWWISQEAAIRKVAGVGRAMGLDPTAADNQLAQHFASSAVDSIALPVELD